MGFFCCFLLTFVMILNIVASGCGLIFINDINLKKPCKDSLLSDVNYNSLQMTKMTKFQISCLSSSLYISFYIITCLEKCEL